MKEKLEKFDEIILQPRQIYKIIEKKWQYRCTKQQLEQVRNFEPAYKYTKKAIRKFAEKLARKK